MHSSKTAVNGGHTSRSAHVVEEIRKRFFTEVYPNSKDQYDEVDIERVRTSEWFIKRYLLAARRNPDEALNMLKTTLAWRKTVQISSTPINTFPREFFQVGGLFQYEPDLDGNPVIYMRIRMHRKIPELAEPIQQFLFYIINKVDLETNSQGAVILFDCSGAGYANMDLDMLKVLSEVAFKYFPFCIKKVIVYELSWMLNAFRRIAMTIIPGAFARIVHFATKDDITNYIAAENLPDFMAGGRCRRDYRAVPEGCPDVETVALERGFQLADVERIRGIFAPYLDEAMAAIEKRKAEEEEEEKAAKRRSEEEDVVPVITSPADEEDEETSNKDNSSGPVAIVRAQGGTAFEDYASLYPQNVITFRRTPLTNSSTSSWSEEDRQNSNSRNSTDQCPLAGTVLLRNNHRSQALAFKVQSTRAEAYSVTPAQGVILPGAYLCINIALKEEEEEKEEGGRSSSEIVVLQDKFMVLLCPEVNLTTDLVSWHHFGRLFLAQADRVFSHKLTTRLAAEDATSAKRVRSEEKSAAAAAESSQTIGRLEREVGRLRQQCRRLEGRQRWLNLVSLLLAVLALALVLWPLAVERPPTWTLLGSLISSVVAGNEQQTMQGACTMAATAVKSTSPPPL